MAQSGEGPYTARIPPAATFVFGVLWRFPLPGPFKRHGRTAPGGIGADKVNIGIFVKVWVGVEFSRYEVLDFPWSRCVDVGEAVDLGIDRGSGSLETSRNTRHYLLRLSNNEGEGEDELVIVG